MTYPNSTAETSDPTGVFERAYAEAAGIPADALDGMVEYACRSAIRDLIRCRGFEASRELVAMYLNDEACGRRL